MIVDVPTAARIVIEGAVIYAVVPLDELGGACPGARLTAFAHEGDYGLQPPYTWSGDNEPPVDQPLIVTCE